MYSSEIFDYLFPPDSYSIDRSPTARKANLYARDVPVPQEWIDWFLKHYEPFFAYAGGDLLGRLPKFVAAQLFLRRLPF
jgi:hypothetical protein